jgi:hypothetical protein
MPTPVFSCIVGDYLNPPYSVNCTWDNQSAYGSFPGTTPTWYLDGGQVKYTNAGSWMIPDASTGHYVSLSVSDSITTQSAANQPVGP